jgi:hypothetical protein
VKISGNLLWRVWCDDDGSDIDRHCYFYTSFCIAVFAVFDYCLEPSACMPIENRHIILSVDFNNFLILIESGCS